MCNGPRDEDAIARIKKEFRERALLVHPDLNGDDPGAGERFLALTAWRVRMLARFEGGCPGNCPEPEGGGGAGVPPPRRSPSKEHGPLIVTLDLEFDDAARGTTAYFPRRVGGSLPVEVPAGVENNHVLRRTVRLADDRTREIAFEVRIAPHPRYWRQGADLLVRVIWTDEQMMSGATVRVPTPWGEEPVVVRRYSQRGEIIRAPGKGLPSPRGRGDLRVELSHTKAPPRSRPGLLD